MFRLLMTAFGGLISGVALWAIAGFLAVLIISRTGGASPDGGGTMAGFFFIGGIGGCVGALVGAIVVWRLLAVPTRSSGLVTALLSLFAIEVIGILIAISPRHVRTDDFPNKRVEMQVEVKFPLAQVAALKKNGVVYELRAAGSTMERSWNTGGLREEGDRGIVPGEFRVHETRNWILGIMNADQQLASITVGKDRETGIPEQTTEWSAWAPAESGLEVRWRFKIDSLDK